TSRTTHRPLAGLWRAVGEPGLARWNELRQCSARTTLSAGEYDGRCPANRHSASCPTSTSCVLLVAARRSTESVALCRTGRLEGASSCTLASVRALARSDFRPRAAHLCSL